MSWSTLPDEMWGEIWKKYACRKNELKTIMMISKNTTNQVLRYCNLRWLNDEVISQVITASKFLSNYEM